MQASSFSCWTSSLECFAVYYVKRGEKGFPVVSTHLPTSVLGPHGTFVRPIPPPVKPFRYSDSWRGSHFLRVLFYLGSQPFPHTHTPSPATKEGHSTAEGRQVGVWVGSSPFLSLVPGSRKEASLEQSCVDTHFSPGKPGSHFVEGPSSC